VQHRFRGVRAAFGSLVSRFNGKETMLADKRAHARRMLDHLERERKMATIPIRRTVLDLRDLNRKFSTTDLVEALARSQMVAVIWSDDEDGCKALRADPLAMRDAIARGEDALDRLEVLVANQVQVEHIDAALTWIEDDMFGEDQIRDWGNMLVAAFGRGELH
jgi:hypothetical protein